MPRTKALTTRLTRQQAKGRTRARLLEAARQMILAGDESRLSAKAVATKAGVGGATFYEHFRNLNDLLRPLADELFDDLREGLRERRRQALAAPGNEERLRQQFRTPLEILAASPRVFRLALRVRHSSVSPLGDSSRKLAGNTRGDLVGELVDRGYPARTAGERRRLEMIADIHIAATEVLALGHLSGRYPDLEEMIDMLVLVTRGTRLAREWRGATRAPAPGEYRTASGG